MMGTLGGLFAIPTLHLDTAFVCSSAQVPAQKSIGAG